MFASVLGAVAVVVRPLRRECVHPALPAFLRPVWLERVLPARGMVRVVGEEPAIQTFPPLTLFRSGWRARWWAEAESRRASGWVARVPFQITSPCVRSADYCTFAHVPRLLPADAVRLDDARSLSLEASVPASRAYSSSFAPSRLQPTRFANVQEVESLHCHRRVVSPSLFSSVMYPPWRETGACNGAGDRPHEDPRSHLTLVATVNAAPAWVAYSYNIEHVQRPWVIAMSWSAANVDVWHCCAALYACVQAL
jgi:hypothetical protein